MDGKNRQEIITRDVKWPNGLAVDYQESRLFWLDAHIGFQRLESSDLDGSKRKILIKGSLPHPFSITIYGEQVYWTDWTNMNIESCNKNTGHERKQVKGKVKHLMGLASFEPERQPKGIQIWSNV